MDGSSIDIALSLGLEGDGGDGDIVAADYLPPPPAVVPLELEGMERAMMESAASVGSSASNGGFNPAVPDAAGGAAALMALPPIILPSAEEAALALDSTKQPRSQLAVASDLALAQQSVILQQLAREQQMLQVMSLAQPPALGAAAMGCGSLPQLWQPGSIGTGLLPACSSFLLPARASADRPPTLEERQQAAASLATAASTSGGSGGGGSNGGSKHCPPCSRLQAVGNELHLQLQGQADKQTPAAELAQQVAGFVVQVATQCEHSSSSGSRLPCLVQLQLPDDAESCWHVTLPKARLAEKGRQRAAAGTASARQFNFHANSPCKLDDTSLQQLLQPGGDADAASYYSIRSKDRNIVAQALVRLPGSDGGTFTQADPCRHLWSPGLIKCAKKRHKLHGTVFDGFRWCFVSIGVKQPQKRKAAAEEE